MGKFAWFIVGLIIGAAVTLVAVTFSGQHERAAPPESEAPLAASRSAAEPEARSTAVAPVPPRVTKITPPRHTVSHGEDDAQMAEDAAAAGMTSRSHRSAPASSDQAPDAAPPEPGPG